MKNRGFGTNFHNVYAKEADLYHEFSASEVFSVDLKKTIEAKLAGGILLDLACGTCHKTDYYSKFFDKVFALDFSKQLLNYARGKYAKNEKLNFLWASGAKIPLLDESVDNILVTWGSFPLTKTIREMQRVLKRGGTIVRIGASIEDEFTTLFPKFSQNRISRINQIFKKFGFFMEAHVVDIKFNSVSHAKRILSKITGASHSKILKSKYKHTIALCCYKKP